MQRKRVVVVSDMHVNSTVGLCPAYVNLDDGGTYLPSKPQKVILKAFHDFCDKSLDTKEPIILILNGDLVEDGNKGTQVISRNKATIMSMAVDVISPLIDKAEKVFVIRGTEYHTGNSGELEESIAQDFDNAVPSKKGTASWWHLRTKISNVRFDVSHHINMGNLPWTEKNAANKLSDILMYRYVEWKEALPDIAIRSHVHRVSDSGLNKMIYSITQPCWCTATAFVHRIGASNAKPHIGGMIIDCDNGKYNVTVERYTPYREKIFNCDK